MLQFNFKIAHIAGSFNTAAGFLSSLQLKVKQEIRLKIREDVQTTPIEVTTSSSDEKHFSFTQTDIGNETEQQTLERKEQSRQKVSECATNEEPSSTKLSNTDFMDGKIDGNTALYSLHLIEANARIRVEQHVDLVLKNRKLKVPHDEVLLTTDK